MRTKVSRRKVILPMAAATGALAAIILTAATVLLDSSKEAALANAARQTERYADGAATALNHSLLGIDVMLADLATLLPPTMTNVADLDGERANRHLRAAINQNLLVQQTMLLNAQGRVLAHSTHANADFPSPLPPPFLQDVIRQTVPMMMISEPTVSFTSGERVLFFARPLPLYGKQAALAVAEVDIVPLAAILGQGINTQGLTVLLERRDGVLLTGSPLNRLPIGRRFDAPLDAHLLNGKAELVNDRFDAPGFLAVRSTLYNNLLITAHMPLDTALADWHKERRRVLIFAAFLAAVILVMGGGAMLYMIRLQQARAAVRQAKANLDDALDSLDNGLVVLDERNRVVSWNRRLLEMYPDIRCDMAVGKEYRGPSWSPRVLFDTSQSSAHAPVQPWTGEEERLLADGRIVLATGRRTPDGGAIHVYADISEKRRAEIDLRVAAIAFEVQEGIMITDADNRILRVNQAFIRITGYTADEVIGKTPSLLKSATHDAAFYQAMWQAIARNGAWQGEVWNRRKNGELYPEWLTITVVHDDAGNISHHVGTFADITSRKAAEEEINTLAFYDPLTGLPNRRLLLDRLKQALAASVRNERHGALLFIDLDYFKNLNDTLGHDIGDVLLAQAAQRLSGCVREGDTVARLGGDEFVVMLEDLDTSPAEAAKVAEFIGEKILVVLDATYDLAGYIHHSTASIGIALFAGHHISVDELLKRADLAMYQAKAAGRNALCFFDPEMQSLVTTRAALEAALRQALQHGQFLLHYQPQIVGEGRLVGAEALVRWCHPQRGMVSPNEFIPLAEDTGLILAIGRWVLETACRQLAQWAAEPATRELILSVNVSIRQFRMPGFAEEVLGVVHNAGINPSRLKLELTESLLADDVEDIIAKMTILKAHGMGFALDDFGTGYSSLSYLKRLPLDQLKIDRSFIEDILTDPNNAAIAKMIVALADSMGLSVIAEGVELPAQRDFLAKLGCYIYQGFLFSNPLPLAEFEDYIAHDTAADSRSGASH